MRACCFCRSEVDDRDRCWSIDCFMCGNVVPLPIEYEPPLRVALYANTFALTRHDA